MSRESQENIQRTLQILFDCGMICREELEIVQGMIGSSDGAAVETPVPWGPQPPPRSEQA